MSRRFASLCLCLACCVASAGCELIADFDRDKIPGAIAGQGGSAPPRADAAMPDGGAEDDAGTE